MSQAANSQVLLDQFLVCGLGSLGQHCVAALKRFEVSVIAIDYSVNRRNLAQLRKLQ